MRITGAYSVAKFVPDRVRFEPVNIGLVVQIGNQVITRMASEIDPRIRLADPYLHTGSLKEFLATFNATTYASNTEESVVDWLHANGVPNIYFSAPSEVDTTEDQVELLVGTLFQRLVARTFERPAAWLGTALPTAAKTALRQAFQTAGVIKKVRGEVPAKGASGVEWIVDFQYVTQAGVNLVEAATTSVREDVRRKEHAFEAFATLIDITKSPGVHGILAVDAPPNENQTSETLRLMAHGHNLRFIAGQRSFHELASEVRRSALPISDQTPLEQLLLK